MTHSHRRAATLAVGVAVVAGLAACAPQPTAPEITTLKVSMLESFQIAGNWNPVTSGYLNVYFAPQQAPYEPLIRLNGRTAQYEPVLAEEFEISQDARSLRIRLREDVDFTDGTHLDAEAVVAYFDALVGAAWTAIFAKYSPVFEVTGEYELTVSSELRVDDKFLFELALIPIASPTALAEDPEGVAISPVGTGPYVLEEQIPEVSVTFVRNPDYRDPNAYPFDEVQFVVLSDPIAALNALKSGQVNVATLDRALTAEAEDNGFAVRAGAGQLLTLTWDDTEGVIAPQLADKRVRQAIAYALDRESIAETIDYGYGDASSQPWSEAAPYYLEGQDDRYSYDLDKARDLMAEAGYAEGFDLEMSTSPRFDVYEPVLIQSFADIGITLSFTRYPDIISQYSARREYAMSPATNGDLAGFGEFPQLAEYTEIVNTGTTEEVAAAQRRMGEIMLEDALVIALARPLDTYATIPEITVDPGVLTLWQPLLQSFQYAE